MNFQLLITQLYTNYSRMNLRNVHMQLFTTTSHSCVLSCVLWVFWHCCYMHHILLFGLFDNFIFPCSIRQSFGFRSDLSIKDIDSTSIDVQNICSERFSVWKQIETKSITITVVFKSFSNLIKSIFKLNKIVHPICHVG